MLKDHLPKITNNKNKLIDVVSNNLDIMCAAVALFCSLVLTIFMALMAKQPVYTIGCALTAICCAVYLIQKKRLFFFAQNQLSSRTRLYLILNILYFALLSSVIILFYLRIDPYVRPISFFILIVVLVTTIATEIITCQLKDTRIIFVLFKIVIIGVILRWTPILMYPDVIGNDPWVHQVLTNALLTSGYMPDFAGKYATMPLYHLLIGAATLITGLEYPYATMFSVNLMQVVIEVLFIFLLGKAMFNSQIGLISGLLLIIANFHVQKAYWTIPNTMGVSVLIITLYFLLTIRSRFHYRGTLICFLLFAALILTHPVVAFFMVVCLISLWVGFIIYDQLNRREYATPVSLLLGLTFIIALLSYWLYVSGLFVLFVEIIRRIFVVEAMVRPPDIVQNAAFSSQLFAYSGMTLFFSLFCIGIFYMISRSGNKNSFAFATFTAIIFGVTALTLFTGRELLGGRWIDFAQVLVVIPLAITILMLGKVILNKIAGVILPLILVMSLAFFMVISPQVNLDNRTFYNMGRMGFFTSELTAINTISQIWSGSVSSDSVSTLPLVYKLNYEIGNNLFVFDNSFINKDFESYRDKFVLIREEIKQHPFGTKMQYRTILDFDPYTALLSQGFSQIYTCNTLHGFAYVKTSPFLYQP